MTIEEAKEYLCYYDSDEGKEILKEDERERPKDCHCDNCFYGRTKLAKIIIELLEDKDNGN